MSLHIASEHYTWHCDGPGCDEFQNEDDAKYTDWTQSLKPVHFDKIKGNSGLTTDFIHLCPDCQEANCKECGKPLNDYYCDDKKCIASKSCNLCDSHADPWGNCRTEGCKNYLWYYKDLLNNPKLGYQTSYVACDGMDCTEGYHPGYDEEPDGWFHEKYRYGDSLDLCPSCNENSCPSCKTPRKKYSPCPTCADYTSCSNCGKDLNKYHNCESNGCFESKQCHYCGGPLSGSRHECTDEKCGAFFNPYRKLLSMKTGSVINCPICGGPTHLSRDTGDFTCDHCGKIVVRANKNQWINSIFDNTALVATDYFIVEAVKKEIQKIIKDITAQGWTVTQTEGGHQKAIWPHAPAGEQVEFFGSTPSDPRAVKNIKSRIDRKMKQYPAPSKNEDGDEDK